MKHRDASMCAHMHTHTRFFKKCGKKEREIQALRAELKTEGILIDLQVLELEKGKTHK
jgi:hypothetical protein